ncbi:MAG: [citrate (pro-3S)-lyase] ligase [Halanaerobiaceae bacterium]
MSWHRIDFKHEYYRPDKDNVELVVEFLSQFDLIYEDDIEETVVIKDRGKIVATASYSKNVIKCIAVAPAFQGQGLLNILITEVKKKITARGRDIIFVYVSEREKDKFSNLGFKEIAGLSPYPVLMEDAVEGIVSFSRNLKENIGEKLEQRFEEYDLDEWQVAGLVVNCNPITRGHLHLMKKAAFESDLVVIFVVSEDKSLFPSEIRYDLVKKATKELENVIVVKGGEYIISHATFPTYFIGDDRPDEKNRLYAELDAKIFARYIAGKLKINKRYVGKEPYSPMTAAYNRALRKYLPVHGIELIEIERKEYNGRPISASRVREFLKDKKWDKIKPLVPQVTYDFLRSSAAKPIIEEAKTSNSRH